MGRTGKRLDIPRFLPMKSDGAEHSGYLTVWECDNGNDHWTSQLMVGIDDQRVASLWLTKEEWIELARLCAYAAASFREDNDEDDEQQP